jgi:hypothetical protein
VRDLQEKGVLSVELTLENCEGWLEGAVVVGLAGVCLVMAVRVSSSVLLSFVFASPIMRPLLSVKPLTLALALHRTFSFTPPLSTYLTQTDN